MNIIDFLNIPKIRTKIRQMFTKNVAGKTTVRTSAIVTGPSGNEAEVNASGQLSVALDEPINVTLDQTTDSVAVGDGTSLVNINSNGNLEIKDAESYFAISKGEVTGHSCLNKFGENPEIDTGSDPEDVWDFGGIYNYSTTDDIDTISSSDSGDTQLVTVIGLDSDWNEVIQTVTLNGQNKVTLTTSLIRVYRAYNSGSVDFTGDIYIYVDGTITSGVPDTDADVRAQIRDGNNQTLMCIYTVPAGKTAYFTSGYIATTKSNSTTATFTWRARPFGGVFQVKSKIAVIGSGSSSWQYNYGCPPALPEKTDVIIRCESVEANNTGVSGGFDLILVDN